MKYLVTIILRESFISPTILNSSFSNLILSPLR
ncbi:hypothetical protein LEP1GSC124_0468, partial [Leptospira interrogans serovar Pyrogenes str. 200701872]